MIETENFLKFPHIITNNSGSILSFLYFSADFPCLPGKWVGISHFFTLLWIISRFYPHWKYLDIWMKYDDVNSTYQSIERFKRAEDIFNMTSAYQPGWLIVFISIDILSWFGVVHKPCGFFFYFFDPTFPPSWQFY